MGVKPNKTPGDGLYSSFFVIDQTGMTKDSHPLLEQTSSELGVFHLAICHIIL